eukprot:FR737293.1.p1 GENE.FR737293.1~~FR737293.1.p1  ORF type:complete len:149 (+),score=56.85 FR737293.1:813-1259(+)
MRGKLPPWGKPGPFVPFGGNYCPLWNNQSQRSFTVKMETPERLHKKNKNPKNKIANPGRLKKGEKTPIKWGFNSTPPLSQGEKTGLGQMGDYCKLSHPPGGKRGVFGVMWGPSLRTPPSPLLTLYQWGGCFVCAFVFPAAGERRGGWV